jgi:hypothetical protein
MIPLVLQGILYAFGFIVDSIAPTTEHSTSGYIEKAVYNPPFSFFGSIKYAHHAAFVPVGAPVARQPLSSAAHLLSSP